MTVMIRGMHTEDIPAHVDFTALMNALFRLVDVLHGAGVTRCVTRLEPGVDLLCAGGSGILSGYAVRQARSMGVDVKILTEDSPESAAFINGILGTLAREGEGTAT